MREAHTARVGPALPELVLLHDRLATPGTGNSSFGCGFCEGYRGQTPAQSTACWPAARTAASWVEHKDV